MSLLTFGLHGINAPPVAPEGGLAEVQVPVDPEPEDLPPSSPTIVSAIVVAPNIPSGGSATTDDPPPAPIDPPEPEPDSTPPEAPTGGSAIDSRPRPPGGGSAEIL